MPHSRRTRQALELSAAHVGAILDAVNGLAGVPVRADADADAVAAVGTVHGQLYRLVHAVLKQRAELVADLVPAVAQAVLRTEEGTPCANDAGSRTAQLTALRWVGLGPGVLCSVLQI